MKIYLVGGAVRDQLLGREVKERDYVVVGATVQEMLALGYRQVGKDFPVFLHPQTKEEYALARVERKVGLGYTGFTFDTSATVTLKEDLKRRDLTINAIAQDTDGRLEDPYGGQNDLKKKILRHVSPAFAEDPVRILRIARFAARFGDFTVAPETIELMRQMVQAGEVDALVPERVWKEFERALGEKNPEKFFELLESCGAMKILFPTVSEQGIKALKQTSDLKIRFAVLLHDNSVEEIKILCERYRVPSDYRDLALLVAQHLETYKNVRQLSADKILNLFQQADAFRRTERFEGFLQACMVSVSPLLTDPSKNEILMTCLERAKAIDVQAIAASGVSGKDIASKIAEERKRVISALLPNTSFFGEDEF